MDGPILTLFDMKIGVNNNKNMNTDGQTDKARSTPLVILMKNIEYTL